MAEEAGTIRQKGREGERERGIETLA